jgi:hypothetical protein
MLGFKRLFHLPYLVGRNGKYHAPVTRVKVGRSFEWGRPAMAHWKDIQDQDNVSLWSIQD